MSTSGPEPPAAASHALLPQWANGQDGWIRAIAGDVLKSRVQPADADIDVYLKLLLAEKKLSVDAYDPVPTLEEKHGVGNALDAVRLDSLTVGDGVNAIKPGPKAQMTRHHQHRTTLRNSSIASASSVATTASHITDRSSRRQSRPQRNSCSS